MATLYSPRGDPLTVSSSVLKELELADKQQVSDIFWYDAMMMNLARPKPKLVRERFMDILAEIF